MGREGGREGGRPTCTSRAGVVCYSKTINIC